MSGPTTRNRSKVKDSDKMNEVKLDRILNNIDKILKWKEQQEKKLDILKKLQCLELTQKGIRADVEELKESHNSFEADLRKVDLSPVYAAQTNPGSTRVKTNPGCVYTTLFQTNPG